MYTTLINEKRPVLTMIEGTYQGQPCNHEVVMVGYSNIKSKFYYIDPSNGLYNYIDYFFLALNIFNKTGIKKLWKSNKFFIAFS